MKRPMAGIGGLLPVHFPEAHSGYRTFAPVICTGQPTNSETSHTGATSERTVVWDIPGSLVTFSLSQSPRLRTPTAARPPLLHHGRLQAASDAPGGHVLTGRWLGVHFPFDHLPHGGLHASLLHDITIEHRKQWPDGSRNVGLQRSWRYVQRHIDERRSVVAMGRAGAASVPQGSIGSLAERSPGQTRPAEHEPRSAFRGPSSRFGHR